MVPAQMSQVVTEKLEWKGSDDLSPFLPRVSEEIKLRLHDGLHNHNHNLDCDGIDCK